MAVSLQSITELSVYPWEYITGPGPLLSTSNFALPVFVPLFCQGYVTYIFCFLEVHWVLFGGCGWFRLDETLPLLQGSLYHYHFCCLVLLWIEDSWFFVCLFIFHSSDFSFSGLNNDTSQLVVHDPYYSLQDPHYFLSSLVSLFYTYFHFPLFTIATILIV